MMEMIREVFTGWQLYIGNQKLVAVLFAVLIFLWLQGHWKEHKTFFVFGLVMTVFCLFPPTAIVLLKYQTRFFDYQWIWTCVPVLLYVAYGSTVFLKEVLSCKSFSRWGKAFVAVFVVVIIICCSSFGHTFSKNILTVENQKELEKTLELIKEVNSDEEICLWAPRDFMAYAREYDGNIRLFYGRNMWDPALNAYSYDVYSAEQNDCYKWMDGICENGKLNQDGVKGVECVTQAFDMGVTHLLLPEDIDSKVIKRLQKKVGVTAHPIDGYIVFMRE